MIPFVYGVGLTAGFFQMLYLNYKLDTNFKNQFQKIDALSQKADDLRERLESIRARLE